MPESFKLLSATFAMGEADHVRVQFVADPDSAPNGTHFTLLMGANGTCKSRILSSCVNFLRSGYDSRDRDGARDGERPNRVDVSERDLDCIGVDIAINRERRTVHPESGDDFLPSRLLALANLVKDRFVFADWQADESPFYYYLGVRQASNLTTTGAMDRLVSDAILHIMSDAGKYLTFRTWLQNLFPEWEIGLSIERFSEERIEEFVRNPRAWMERPRGEARVSPVSSELQLRAIAGAGRMAEFATLMRRVGGSISSSERASQKGKVRFVSLENLLPEEVARWGDLRPAIEWATRIRLFGRPSVLLRKNLWLDFKQLSSGEQNLLSTAARLIAYATEGSFIIIDEPEVSLNVAWQQRYMELVSKALVHAPGSHVLIASHSPYLVSDLRTQNATVVVIERKGGGFDFKTHPGEFWGWGSEAILYRVLGVPSASNYEFSRDLATVLRLVQSGSTERAMFEDFLSKCDDLELSGAEEPLRQLIDEIRAYYQENVR